MKDRASKERAVQLIELAGQSLFDRFSHNPVVYSAMFNKEIKRISKEGGVTEEYLWQRYMGVSPEEVEKKKGDKKVIIQKLKLVELKTPRSSWWLAKKKKTWKALKYRLVMIPNSEFVYVRVPTYVNRYDWLQGLRFPVKLLKSVLRQKALEDAVEEIRKPSKFPLIVGNFWEEQREDKELKVRYKKQARLQEVIQEILKHRVGLMLDKVGERVGFNRAVVIDNLFTGKDYLEERWQCKEGHFCPCGSNKRCTILKEVKQLTSLEAR